MKLSAVILLILPAIALAQWNPNLVPGRIGIVHLFSWKFTDVANECENWLGPMGYGAVQVSPITEHPIVVGRPWWESYQPISWLIEGKYGTEAEFRDMVDRCSAVGVKIVVDVVFNHVTDRPGIGSAGSVSDPANLNFPAIPLGPDDFNTPPCGINYFDAMSVRNCWLLEMPDLDQKQPAVRQKIADFLNKLIDIGVAGFRVDGAKHMWPEDLQAIYDLLKPLNTAKGFPAGSKPYYGLEVIDLNPNEPVKKTMYNMTGAITEFKFSAEIGRAFHGRNDLRWLVTWGEEWGFIDSEESLTFVDNHDNQRGHGAGGADILTFRTPRNYKMAVAYMLSHPYGRVPRIMCSYDFSDADQGPPQDAQGNILSPIINRDGQCEGGYICEHRWLPIANMISFRRTVGDEPLLNWWDNARNQIAFSRGNKGFVAFNLESADMNESLQTGLPAGTYCDVATGGKVSGACVGTSVTVGATGLANISIPASTGEGFLAIHEETRL